ncbi:sigma-70 family RNA polymerase sigma factor [Bacteriovorax sp. Seq25_V]|uniref:sigma-70 family RNA polymerase sigma factor n=1 Tax=Bacteriovorax sp. Seq25_V TaxID=1201288 RepID=UPI0003F4CD1E|nr:sigma-70 family RNA polymerase sigma factor [Bacteriovorax sp. Seq25_V]
MEEFKKYRALLMAISYRMMGTFTEAEDIVQEVSIEWFNTKREEILNPKSWLVRVTTNKAIDALKKAYRKREIYTGTWLPEIMPDSLITWEDDLDIKESLNTSFLILLENLSPKERAVYLLSEIFEYNSHEVSELLNSTESNCRKIKQRAKEKIKNRNLAKSETSEESLKIVRELFDALRLGHNDIVENLLLPDSEFWSDGGGKVSAARNIIIDINKISRFLTTIFKNLENDEFTYKYDFTNVNGLPGLVFSKQNSKKLWNLETVFSFEIECGKVSRIYAQRNPDKISYVENIFL